MEMGKLNELVKLIKPISEYYEILLNRELELDSQKIKNKKIQNEMYKIRADSQDRFVKLDDTEFIDEVFNILKNEKYESIRPLMEFSRVINFIPVAESEYFSRKKIYSSAITHIWEENDSGDLELFVIYGEKEHLRWILNISKIEEKLIKWDKEKLEREQKKKFDNVKDIFLEEARKFAKIEKKFGNDFAKMIAHKLNIDIDGINIQITDYLNSELIIPLKSKSNSELLDEVNKLTPLFVEQISDLQSSKVNQSDIDRINLTLNKNIAHIKKELLASIRLELERVKRERILNQNKKVLYIIGGRKDGAVKIGISNDVEKRLKQIQTGNSEQLRIIKMYKSINARDEKTIHNMLNKYRLEGEWFDKNCMNNKLWKELDKNE